MTMTAIKTSTPTSRVEEDALGKVEVPANHLWARKRSAPTSISPSA